MPRHIKLRHEKDESDVDNKEIVRADIFEIPFYRKIPFAITRTTEDKANAILSDISNLSLIPGIAISLASLIYLLNQIATSDNEIFDIIQTLVVIHLLSYPIPKITEFTEEKLTKRKIAQLIQSGRRDLADSIKGIIENRQASDQV
jgi:uncharacterized membrane protein